MHQLAFLIGIGLLAILGQAGAEEPDDEYVRIYNLIQQADGLVAGGQSTEAREKYLKAQTALQTLQNSRPDWHPQVVQFRLRYVTEKMQPLSAGVESKSETPATTKIGLPETEEATDPLRLLRTEIRQLMADKELLQAKLKEALSAQPAAVDPRELKKADERTKALEKELELLRVHLRKAEDKPDTAVDPVVPEATQKAFANANANLTRQNESIAVLNLEKELADAKAAAQTNAGTVLALRMSLKTAQEESAVLERAKNELATQLANARRSTEPPSLTGSKVGSVEVERIKQLERERDELQKKFSAVTRELYDRNARGQLPYLEQLTNQLAILRARAEVLEARRIPYSPDEVALLKMPELKPSKTDPQDGRKSKDELPAGAVQLVGEAERAFNAHRLQEAETKYEQALRLDDRNVGILANLAVAQMEQDRLEEAEKTLQRALAEAPRDAFSLSILGVIKVRQKKYTEALEALSRSAQIDPQHAETHNYLGVVLVEKGLRGPAESAFRRAIQLSPAYADAHHNLAVVYAAQQPPATELARWHYQKALAAGHPPNPELEKTLNRRKSTAAAN